MLLPLLSVLVVLLVGWWARMLTLTATQWLLLGQTFPLSSAVLANCDHAFFFYLLPFFYTFPGLCLVARVYWVGLQHFCQQTRLVRAFLLVLEASCFFGISSVLLFHPWVVVAFRLFFYLQQIFCQLAVICRDW